jgi:hypothetical protein
VSEPFSAGVLYQPLSDFGETMRHGAPSSRAWPSRRTVRPPAESVTSIRYTPCATASSRARFAMEEAA